MSQKSFATALKAAREAAGLSQAALARKAGLTGSYLSVLEARRRRPPSARVVAALAKALGIDDEELQDLAALERSPGAVRQRLERLDRERGRALRTRDRVLTTTLFHIAHRPTVTNPLGVGEFPDLSYLQRSLVGRLVDRVRRVRSVAEAEERVEEILGDTAPRDRDALAAVLPRVLSPAPGTNGAAAPVPADGTSPAPAEPVAAPSVTLEVRDRLGSTEASSTLEVDAAMVAPRAFLWRVTTDDAWPKVERGDLVVVDPDRTPAYGDLVAFEHAGRDQLRTWSLQGDEVRLLSPRAEVPPVRLPAASFRPAGVVRWILRAL